MIALRYAGALLLLVIAVALPVFDGAPLAITIAFYTLIFAIMATGWNILGGYSGYISLGHAAFFGVGAYALGLVAQHYGIPGGYEPFFLLPVVGIITAIIAVPIGIITLRTRRHVFVVLTIAMLFIGQLLATNLSTFTGGSSGLALPVPPWMGAAFNYPYYYAALTVLVGALLVSWWIRQSKFGLALLAIRDDEDRALGLGINTGLYKLAAFVLAAFFIGMAGALWAYFVTYIYPQFAFDPLFDIAMVLMSFAGGVGTLSGPVLGAVLIEPAQQYLTLTYGNNGWSLVLYGALFLVIILLLPQGIIPGLRTLWERYETRRHAEPPVTEARTPVDRPVPRREGANQ